MHKRNFIARIRRRVNRQLFLCINKVQAAKLGIHPEVTQVWCKGTDGAPFFVHAIHAEGFPREASEIDVVALQKMSTQNVVGGTGHRSWLDEMERGANARYVKAEEETVRRMERWFSPGGEGFDRAMHLTGNHLVVPMRQPLDKRADLRVQGPR